MYGGAATPETDPGVIKRHERRHLMTAVQLKRKFRKFPEAHLLQRLQAAK